jgi:hypothetical protein
VDVEAVREHQRRTLLHVVVQMLAVDVALQFVGGEHHDEVGPFGGFGDFHHLEAGGLRLLGRGRALAERNGHFLDAGILQVQRVGVTLTAIADDDDLFALDQVQVGITIIINSHSRFLLRGPEIGRLIRHLGGWDRRVPANFRRCLEHFPPQGKPFSRMTRCGIMRP